MVLLMIMAEVSVTIIWAEVNIGRKQNHYKGVRSAWRGVAGWHFTPEGRHATDLLQ